MVTIRNKMYNNTKMKDTFATRLAELRKEKGYSQEELAKQINVSRSTIAAWETERNEPNMETLKSIANFFGVTVDFLIARTDY